MAAPVVMAIIAQALANAGQIGAGVSDIFGAQGIMSDDEETKLRKLQQAQESGTMGLSKGAMSTLQQGLLGPQKAQFREARETRDASLGAAGASPADIFRAEQGAVQRDAETLQPTGAKLASAQEAERVRQEKQLLELSRTAAQEDAAKKQAYTKTVVAALGAGGEMMEAGGQAKADKEGIDSTESSGADLEKATELLGFLSEFMK